MGFWRIFKIKDALKRRDLGLTGETGRLLKQAWKACKG